jgi:hypothetical protein
LFSAVKVLLNASGTEADLDIAVHSLVAQTDQILEEITSAGCREAGIETSIALV